jgi:hypothetical protein
MPSRGRLVFKFHVLCDRKCDAASHKRTVWFALSSLKILLTTLFSVVYSEVSMALGVRLCFPI